jgi:predicted TIM-barrel fold metal-dependent hydrolase
MNSQSTSGVHESLAGMPIIDVDTHLTERHDLWTSRASGKFRDKVPQVREVNGRRAWFINGDIEMIGTNAHSTLLPNLDKAMGWSFSNLDVEDVHAASYDAKARMALMDTMGIHAQILYPNLLGFGGQRASKAVPEDIRLASIQIYNDAMGEVQAQGNNRLFPMGMLPWWDVKGCVKEVERCHKMGLRGVNTNSDPQGAGLPDLGTEHWNPLYEAVSDLNMPVNFHIGASDESGTWFQIGTWPSGDEDRKLALGSVLMFLGNARVIGNILYSGILERFPKLKFVSVESGIGWMPFALEALDYQVTQMRPESFKHLKMKPSEYFRRQIYGCFWFERKDAPYMIERVGVDNVMFETDFPHPTCLYPDPMKYVGDTFASLDPKVREKVMFRNAAKLYNIPLN